MWCLYTNHYTVELGNQTPLTQFLPFFTCQMAVEAACAATSPPTTTTASPKLHLVAPGIAAYAYPSYLPPTAPHAARTRNRPAVHTRTQRDPG
jgi:hypothetical protein